MKIRQTIAAAAVLGLSMTAISQAQAATELVDFNAGGATANLTLDVVGGQAISGTGTYSVPGLSITNDLLSLVTLSTANVHDLGGGNLSYRFGGGTDLIGDTLVPISNNGLVFIDASSGASDIGFNIWSNGGSSYSVFLAGNNGIYNGYDGTATITAAVPEPATWAMLLLGFFGTGFMMRGTRRKAAVAVA